MKTGFKERVKLEDKEAPKSTWDFSCPSYDERTSCFQNAGTRHGVGVRQPVGIEGNPKKAYAVPMGRVNTLETDEKD